MVLDVMARSYTSWHWPEHTSFLGPTERSMMTSLNGKDSAYKLFRFGCRVYKLFRDSAYTSQQEESYGVTWECEEWDRRAAVRLYRLREGSG